MCFKKKCNWCAKKKKILYRIDFWCKWYDFYICKECYHKKLNSQSFPQVSSKKTLRPII